MQDFQIFLKGIDEPDKRQRMKGILKAVKKNFPHLKEEIKWNQPMFTDHATFIIGFSLAKNHIAVAPEGSAIRLFAEEIAAAGYSHTVSCFASNGGMK